MAKSPGAKRRTAKLPAGRVGRPPRERAGEVDARILAAARRVFLERGLAGASIDEIANVARAGKPTIYARFPGKEALFAAVAMSNVTATAARFEGHVPTGSTLDERLAKLGTALVHWILASDIVAVMRLGISEARRFPDLAINVHLTARRRGEEIVGKLLAETAHSDALGALAAFAPERLATTARFFIDLVVWPILTRALFGEKLQDLRAEVETDVVRSVAFFLAACRHDGVP
jgi:AcrR family transcriptional regulator